MTARRITRNLMLSVAEIEIDLGVGPSTLSVKCSAPTYYIIKSINIDVSILQI